MNGEKDKGKEKNKGSFNRAAFKRAISMIESSGGKYLDSKYSSAAGRYHFLYNLIKNDPDMKGVTKRQFMNDYDLQEKIMDKAIEGKLQGYVGYKDHASRLKSEFNTNLNITEIAALTHFLGSGGARKYLRDPGSYSVPGQVNATPEAYLEKFRRHAFDPNEKKQEDILPTVDPAIYQDPAVQQAMQIPQDGTEVRDFQFSNDIPIVDDPQIEGGIDALYLKKTDKIDISSLKDTIGETKEFDPNTIPEDEQVQGGTPAGTVVEAFAGGGQMGANQNQVVEFNSGGTHNQNKHGGIPMGMGANGKMNTVEEGETKFGDYVFSNRITLDGKRIPSDVNSNQFAEGGKLRDCGGPGQPPCVEIDNVNVQSKIKKDPFKTLDNPKDKEDFKGKDTVKFFNYLKEILPQEQYKKFVNQHNLAGNPTINFSKDNIRANYNDATNSMNINYQNIDNYLAELSHASQLENGDGGFRPKDIVAKVKDLMFGDQSHYKTPGYQEHEAHEIIQKDLGNKTGYTMDADNLAASDANKIDYYSLLKSVVNTDRVSLLEKEGKKTPSYKEALEIYKSLKNEDLESLLPKMDDPVKFDEEKKKFDKNYVPNNKMANGGFIDPVDPTKKNKKQGPEDKSPTIVTKRFIDPVTAVPKNENMEIPRTEPVFPYQTSYGASMKPSNTPEGAIQKKFVDWYSHPETIKRIQKQGGPAAKVLDDFISKGVRGGIKKGTPSNKEADAEYNPNTEEITMVNPNDTNTGVHEVLHRSGLDQALSKPLMDILGNSFNQKDKKTFSQVKRYMNQPHEAYGNFAEFRNALELKPGENITKEELLKKVKEKGLESENFYRTFDDEKITKAINEVARLYKRKGSRVKKELEFRTPADYKLS